MKRITYLATMVGGSIVAAALTFAGIQARDIIYQAGRQAGRDEVRQATMSRLFNESAKWESRSEDSLLAEMPNESRQPDSVLLNEAMHLLNTDIDEYIEQNSHAPEEVTRKYGFSW